MEREIEEALDFEEDAKELETADAVRNARDTAIAILQNRQKDIYQRIIDFLIYAREVQECLNREAYGDIPECGEEKCLDMQSAGTELLQDADYYYFFRERMKSFQELEWMNEEWGQYLERMEALFLKRVRGKCAMKLRFGILGHTVRSRIRNTRWSI